MLAMCIQARYAKLSKGMAEQLRDADGDHILVLKWDELVIEEYLILLTLDALIVILVLWTLSPQDVGDSDVLVWSLIILGAILVIPTILCEAVSRQHQLLYHITPTQIVVYKYGRRNKLTKRSMAWKDIVRVDLIDADDSIKSLQFESEGQMLIISTTINDIFSLYAEMGKWLPPLVLSSHAAESLSPFLNKPGKLT